MTITPMMAQFLEIKNAHKDSLLFYRMGDFYEMFFDDAVAAAEALDITLTKRGKHEDADIPMCGVPVHAAEGYLLTLIRKGFRVAVCEQLESPAEAKKRGYKSVVKRDVVRVVTPGTLTEDTLLDARRHNFLAAYAEVRDEAAIAWFDISTGALFVQPLSPARLGAELARIAPSELVVSDNKFAEFAHLEADFGISVTELSRASFDSASAKDRLCKALSVSSLDAFGSFERAELGALGALIAYVDLTQKGQRPHLQPPRKEHADQTVQIDAATRKSLELTHALSGGREGSLLRVIDKTLTAGGARLLERRLSSPTRNLEKVNERQDAIAFALENTASADDLEVQLRKVPDLERALSRLSLDRGGPRDLSAIRTALEQSQDIGQALSQLSPPQLLAQSIKDISGHEALTQRLANSLVDEPPLMARDGGFIAAGVDAELDEVRHLRDEGRSVIASLQEQYQALTQVNSLKVKHNNVLGYFIETPATHGDKLQTAPLSETFIHRQTTANQVRFTTVELSELERKIQNAGQRAIEIEKALFETLREAVLKQAGPLYLASQGLSELDLQFALARLARAENWTRPTVDNSRDFNIEAGRHPVVERALQSQSGDPFIANSCDLSAEENEAALWLLTGPNMAGKSTFLRQNALIAILAQMGSYVPAKSAKIGLVSQIFSRVGASDDLARGRSTFMVEMVETAAILNQSDDRALVILDEIGRGTATYDGLSIAWATLEHLHGVNKCRALFATHYHELTVLAGKLDGVQNATVAVKEWEGEVIFLHEVHMGAADRSYGVQVAKLAGLPATVVERARTVLAALENEDREGAAKPKALIDDLPLFSATPPLPAPKTSELETLLSDVIPDDLSPKEALDLIYKLKAAT